MLLKLSILLLIGCTLSSAQMGLQLKDVELKKVDDGTIIETSTHNQPIIAETTDKANTTTTPPTTAKPTTTKPTTTKPTTTKPTTIKPTTVAPITTTAAPAPYPEPSIGTWNSSCIMIKMAIQLNFTYETKDNKTNTVLYNVPSNAIVDDASCEYNTTQSIQINWGPNVATHSMLIQFDRDEHTVNMTLLRFVIVLTPERFPNAKENQTIQLVHRGFDFGVPISMSYHCTRPQQFNLTETIDKSTVIGHATLHDVQTEAFRTSPSQNFSMARDCDSTQTSDIVPIAVGIALVALILIVLVSYLCARRRSTLRGYMSF